ncbi:MAG: plastocyanin/azurin family copper-binding protein [Anaerolineaceae bacterium]|nr:plastocyanin/azurin family copper-binding protein [Anaerolineaceae bacterium]
MKKYAMYIGLVLALSLVLAACGGGGGSSTGGTNISATMTDFKFDPSTWTVPAGKQVSLKLTNSGSVEHSWVLMSKPISGSFTDADKANVLFSKTVPAGQSDTLTFTAPATAGDYQVVCDIAGHFEAGMVAKLTVQ